MHLRVSLASVRSTRRAVRATGSRSVVRASSDLVASFASTKASIQIRSYATPAKATPKELTAEEEESARVWRSIEDLDEDYDPEWDTEVPENEYEGTKASFLFLLVISCFTQST